MTIRTSEPRELLALIPFQLGFHPAESAVLISLRGARSRVGLIARVDLADLGDEVSGPPLARSLVGSLVADGARRVVVVIYSAEDLQRAGGDDDRHGHRDGDGSADTAGPAGRAVRALEDAAGYHLEGIDCWVVGPTGYYSPQCVDPACCPPGGRPLSDLQATRVGAEMVLQGVGVAPSRDDLVVIPVAGAAQRRAARRARDRWRARGAAAAPGAAAHRWRREGLTTWRATLEDALAGGLDPQEGCAAVTDLGAADPAMPLRLGARPTAPLPAAQLGRLLAALDDVLVRDAVLLTFVAGNDRVADRLVAGESGADIGRALGAITDPTCGQRPDARRCGAARAVLEAMVGHAPRAAHAPALTLLAVLAWWAGDGARAGILVDRALDADPGYRLALLVDQALRAGMPPGWARAG